MYRRMKDSDCIQRISDNANIPPDAGNSDYQEFTAWVAAGNIILPVEPPTPEQLAAQAKAEAQAELVALDLASIRSIREYIVTKQDAPTVLLGKEALAIDARKKLK